jgi:hypothetical protein
MRSACIDQKWILQSVHTIKLVATSQSSTAATTEDAFPIAQCAYVRATGLTQAVLVGEGDDSATYTGSDARDALRQVTFELVRTGCTGAVEGQGDSRAFGVGWSVGLLARVLGFRGESDVEAGNEVCSGWRVRTGLRQAGCQVVESMSSAEGGSDLSQTCLL